MTGAVDSETTIHIVLEPGVYRESIRYNIANPLIMESVPGTSAENCVVQADNCEAFNAGRENRAICVIGPNAKKVTLKNFSLVNTHIKSVQDKNTKPDSAEAFVWSNTDGILKASGMRFEGRQNTLFVKGLTWFSNCYINGDIDVVYGEPEISLFENCTINLREDNRGDYDGFAVKARTKIGKKGFVFDKCIFTGDKRKKASLYVYRTAGLGTAISGKNFDNVVFLNCQVSQVYSPDFEWDDDMQLNICPRGNATAGIREYGTLDLQNNGTLTPSDTSRHNVKSYTLTNDDFYRMYSSRYLIFGESPLAAFVEES